jgi:multiple sugar transport system permease protein
LRGDKKLLQKRERLQGGVLSKAINFKRKKYFIGWLFSLPAIVVFLLFKYYPIMQAFHMSLYRYAPMKPPGQFVGLRNYIYAALEDPLVTVCWKNNLIILLFSILLGFWVLIVQAILLNEVRFGKSFYRLLYLLPTAVPPMVLFIVWKFLYNPDFGLLNSLLAKIGLGPYGWLNDPRTSKISLCLPGLLGDGLKILGGSLAIFLYLAALQGIPLEMFEAADIDGANPFQKLRYILIPQLRPMIFIQFIIAISIGFQLFDQIFVMTGGGPVDSTRVLTLSIYHYAFRLVHMGYASAIAVLLFLVTFVIVALQFNMQRIFRR